MTVSNAPKIINKLFDTQDLHRLARKAVLHRLLTLIDIMDKTGIPYSEPHLQRLTMRLWEYSHVIVESGVDARMKVLDAGGSGSVLSYYLAAEGCNVTTVDISHEKVNDAIKMMEYLLLKMSHFVQSIASLTFPDEFFDSVFCVCVIEHLDTDQQPIALRELARVLKPGGVLSLTFDYGKEGADNPILNESEILERLVLPSGLEISGNTRYYTKGQLTGIPFGNPNKNIGSLFLKKAGELLLPIVCDCTVNPFPCLKCQPTSGEVSTADSL